MHEIKFVAMLYLYFGVFILYGVFSSNVQASSLDELQQKYVGMIMQCSHDYPLTVNDLMQLRRKKMPDNESVKCLFACVYKKAGMMNDKGELWVEGVNAMTRKYLSDDPVKIQKSEEFVEACKSVNDVPVSDGERGCDRGALIYKCTVEKAPEFDFV